MEESSSSKRTVVMMPSDETIREPSSISGDQQCDKTSAIKSQLERFRDREGSSGFHLRNLGITWKGLSVQVTSDDATIHENFLSQFNIRRRIRESKRKTPLRTILDNSHGCVKPGEMLLVLGRPGSGCTTLLSILANRRRGYASVAGDVHYGSLAASEATRYHGQIVMNTEDELFFPTLTVAQTMDFATRLKTPLRSHNQAKPTETPQTVLTDIRGFLLRSLGIEHTRDTKVGNEFVRGVSGGERKRVSITECLATRGSIFCWDNSTRGLDASTALEYVKTLRAFTDALGLTTIVTLYQTGNGIFDLFDKVLVLDCGQQIYYGPMKEARPFAESIGFVCSDGANTADFLTGISVPTERQIRHEYETSFPRTTRDIRTAYEESGSFTRMKTEYDYPETEIARQNTQRFQETIAQEKHPRLPSSSSFSVSFVTQVKVCITRQYQIIWGDKVTFFTKQISTVALALIAGSLFYNAPSNSAGLFVKSGALFFALLYNTLTSMSEVANSFNGRPVLLKHKSFALFHPAAFCIAQITTDIPVIVFQISLFSIILYFMVGLTLTARAFFTYWALLFVTAMTTTSMFRAIGASSATFDEASKWSGITIGAVNLYNGYMFTKQQMRPWFVWLFWVDPLAYAFDGLLSNELHDKTVDCVGENLVPFGPGYEDRNHQSCAGVGGVLPGQAFVTGEQYLASLSYNRGHVWRNVGILWPVWGLFAMVTIISTSRWTSAATGLISLLVPRERANPVLRPPQEDEEAPSSDPEKPVNSSAQTSRLDVATVVGDDADGDAQGPLLQNNSVLTWNDLSYTIETPSGDRLLLDKVQGWVKPGMLGALMGASGAGKTTLLDVLAQRKTEGIIRGSITVDGHPLPISFQRSAGYCEQLDVHEPFATVREALEFSALLRQDRHLRREDKLKYVDTILDLLELNDLADTLIGRIGAGLTPEQRKRVTIGVELVSKPSILIFLDEPTSGLDGQSAYNTVRFLRKLADAGQAVLVTIHQPSAQLFVQFDTLLLLAKGGKTVYFGDIGKDAQTVKGYFAKHGAPCPEVANPAEHMIDVVSGPSLKGEDWHSVWLDSAEHGGVVRELESIISTGLQKPPPAVTEEDHEFATPLWDQLKIVTHRTSVSLFRNTDYVNNKFMLHIASALFNGFSFWMIGQSVADLKSRLFTVFNFIFVAPGALNQLQPLFIERRNIFETREAKSKMYSWVAFVTATVVSEIPYLFISAVLYFVCWYYTVGFPADPSRAGATFFAMLIYEFVYTGIGQFVAAYAPSAMSASLLSPVIIGILVPFCGVLVPYSQIQTFWRYWIYYLNPFTYLMGGMLTFDIWGTSVTCSEGEFAVFDPPNRTTCGQYLKTYLDGVGSRSNLVNPEAKKSCRVCQYGDGSDYLQTLNITDYHQGWRDVGVVIIFVISSYSLVYLLMKLRTGKSRKAEAHP